jgi:hypothetical protein
MSVPQGTRIFTDFEFLDGFGLTLAAAMAGARCATTWRAGS